ncbi:GNAT family N-acetyltransferase [uncultured Jatrophihabitans sp.]|uniref:GNAT family N-acetyltransferase n=1 Tax=uncultured Jatrophihabitans sp. TaxID=1610747 RepID=UPI0035CB5582
MPFALEPSWLGRRVSVRRVVDRDPDGRLLMGDVVGELVGLDAQTAVVDARRGLVEVPLAFIVAARLVMPSTADELALERVVAAGWRAEQTTELDGWLLRADHGFTRRANSIAPLAQVRVPLDDALAQVRAWYGARGLPTLVQVPLEARRLLDAELGERGWGAEGRAQIMVAHLPAESDPPPARVRLAGTPDPAWLARYRAHDDAAAAAPALLTRHNDATFASVEVAGQTVGVARGCVDDGWLGVSAVEVDPAHRRAGHAAALTRTLWAWGAGRGARRSYVQVESDNAPALALYERLGYWRHHEYHYRREPADDAVDHSLPGSIPAPYA